jgi:hypothetical protein
MTDDEQRLARKAAHDEAAAKIFVIGWLALLLAVSMLWGGRGFWLAVAVLGVNLIVLAMLKQD